MREYPLFRLPNAVEKDPEIARWFQRQTGDLAELAKRWFEHMRSSGADVREVLHDNYPTVCVGDVAFAYVGLFKAHVNVGFFRGAVLEDSSGLLEGSGKMMRHVKVGPARSRAEVALPTLIRTAYLDIKKQIADSGLPPTRSETTR